MKARLLLIILILLSILGCFFTKEKNPQSIAEDLCTNYVNNKQIMKPYETMNDEEIYNQCMELYGYGKNKK